MKLIRISLVLLLIPVFVSCSNNPTESEIEVTENGQTLYLLGMDADPMGIESGDTGDFDFHFRGGFMNRHFGHGSEGRPAFCLDAIGRLIDALGLTDDQIAQIEPISDKHKASFDELYDSWEEGTLWQEIREQRQVLREAFWEEIKPILTEEQIVKLEEIRSMFDRGKFPEDVAHRRLDWLTRTLELTTEQQEQISALLVAASEELMSIRDSSEDRDAFHAAAQTVLETLNEQIAALLTEGQLGIYNEFPHHRRWRQHWRNNA
jgi:hypothetical protein